MNPSVGYVLKVWKRAFQTSFLTKVYFSSIVKNDYNKFIFVRKILQLIHRGIMKFPVSIR